MPGEHEFTCHSCEYRRPSTDIEYDTLGYPVCPLCGKRHGPLGASVTQFSWVSLD